MMCALVPVIAIAAMLQCNNYEFPPSTVLSLVIQDRLTFSPCVITLI